jgi:hypothetical protein
MRNRGQTSAESQAHPRPLWHVSNRLMQLLSHALPFSQIRQHWSAGMHAAPGSPSSVLGAAPAEGADAKLVIRITHALANSTRPRRIPRVILPE